MTLKRIRVGVSFILFLLITFYFVDFAALLPDSYKWVAQIQFVPALLSLNLIVLIALVCGTLLFGRVYCSSICPMGVYQDAVSWFSKRIGKKKRYTFSKAKTILRWGVLAITIATFLVGFTALLGLLDPYSAYGRIVANIFRPVYAFFNNLLEAIFTSFGNYTFYKVEISIYSYFAFAVSLFTLFAVGFLAWRHGRTFCNTICPVGTILGFLSRFSLFKVMIDTNACNGCGSCATKCKASCINSKEHVIDNSRCVNCFNCLGSCNKHAISYNVALGKKVKSDNNNTHLVDAEKRRFLSAIVTTSITVPTAIAQNKMDALSTKKVYKRTTPISPPGSKSIGHLKNHCTSCHLCVSRCPSRVLKPSFTEYGLEGIMQPMMFFEKGFCNFDCTVCSDICPNGAIEFLSVEEKHKTQVGRVNFIEDICVVHTENTNCGACSEHCPTQAVSMVPYHKEGTEGLTIPHINPDICVGCGGCEFICPVRPYRAIYVEGNTVHKEALVIKEKKKEEVKIDDFGF